MALATKQAPCAYRGVTDYAKELGERLRVAREAAGLTQQRAAADADVDIGTLSKYELGKVAEPSMAKVRRLALLYGVRVDWLDSGTGPMKHGEERVERDDELGYPGVEAYIEAHPELEPDEIDAARRLRRSGGPDEITYEVVDGFLRGRRAAKKGRAIPRPKLTE